MTGQILRLEALSKYYTAGQSVVMGLNTVSLSFRLGEFVAITGESGSGKSTLAHVLGGITPYESGEMYFNGQPTSHFDGADYERYRAEQISFISQSYGILPGATVLENTVCALRLAGVPKAQALEHAEPLLRQVELWELRGRRAARLSSGQKQRLAIARALAKPAPILIADEPTGNLDPENSAKVMALLAQAAKSRLVLLITHEFPEAEPYATRRIHLQDGKIVLDAPLREPPQLTCPTSLTRHKQALAGYIASVQLRSRPVWTSLVLLFFAVTAFCVFAFLGTFQIELDDTDTRIYDSDAFPNGSRERIVAVRSDLAPMTQADYAAILAVENLAAIERWGYLADIQYAYREGVDYDLRYGVIREGSDRDQLSSIAEFVTVKDSAPYLQTVPLLSTGTFLTAGRLPAHLYEVVAAGPESLMGASFTVFLHDPTRWSASVEIELTVTVVGTTAWGEGLFFHDDLGRAVNDWLVFRQENALLLYSHDLSGDIMRVSEDFYASAARHKAWTFQLSSPTEEAVTLQLIAKENGNTAQGLSPTHSAAVSRHFQVSPEVFHSLVLRDNCDQLSLTVTDHAYTDSVLEQLHTLGYTAVSPFRECSTRVDAKLAAERLQTLALCAAALAAAVVLQVLALRFLFGTQLDSYEKLRSMGLRCRDARRSVFLQILLLGILGQLTACLALGACGLAQVSRIILLLRYLPWGWYPVMSAVHLAAAMAAAWWSTAAIEAQLYPMSRQGSDLPPVQEEVLK